MTFCLIYQICQRGPIFFKLRHGQLTGHIDTTRQAMFGGTNGFGQELIELAVDDANQSKTLTDFALCSIHYKERRMSSNGCSN